MGLRHLVIILLVISCFERDSTHLSFRQYSEELAEQKIDEIEHKYEIAIKEYEINRLKQRQVIWIIVISLSSVIAILSVLFYLRTLRQQKENERSRRIIKKLLISTCGINSSFKSIMEHPASPDGTQSFNEYRKTLKQIDSSFKRNISRIINDNLSTDPAFSEQERAVLFLIHEGFDRKEISLILNISQDSVRAVISNINSKSV